MAILTILATLLCVVAAYYIFVFILGMALIGGGSVMLLIIISLMCVPENKKMVDQLDQKYLDSKKGDIYEDATNN